MNEPTDTSLVNVTLAGDTESFCALVRRYQDRVYGVTLGVLADFHLALDAAQEAFLCAFCDLPKLKAPERFGAWLCGIARNTAFEMRRDRQRQEALAKKAAAYVRTDDPSTQQIAAGNEERVMVQQALQSVNRKDREALSLYYADELSYSEICDFLSISKGTLKGRLQRGRAVLRKELAMVKHICRDNAPDEEFARRLDKAIRIFSAKGPTKNHIPSEWLTAVCNEERQILAEGEEGVRIDTALSHSGSRRLRERTVIRFGLRRDEKSLTELERMLDDRSARLRRQAVRWYGGRIHPDPSLVHVAGYGREAAAVPDGLENILAKKDDPNHNVRFAVVQVLGSYVHCGDVRVTRALEEAMKDAKHKVRHAAARILGRQCPGCGRIW